MDNVVKEQFISIKRYLINAYVPAKVYEIPFIFLHPPELTLTEVFVSCKDLININRASRGSTCRLSFKAFRGGSHSRIYTEICVLLASALAAMIFGQPLNEIGDGDFARDLHFHDDIFPHLYSLGKKSLALLYTRAGSVVEANVNSRAEETHTTAKAILSLKGNDSTWLHALLHACTSVLPLLGTPMLYFPPMF